MVKCDPRVFARCPYKGTCGSIEEAVFPEDSDCDLYNQKVLRTPVSNADRIRGMSDRELSAFLYTLSRSCADHTCLTCPIGMENCQVILKWLKREAEEG